LDPDLVLAGAASLRVITGSLSRHSSGLLAASRRRRWWRQLPGEILKTWCQYEDFQKIAIFVRRKCLFFKLEPVFTQKISIALLVKKMPIFARKMLKIAGKCDHNSDPCSHEI
jgi:hypothetical protein